MTVAHWRLLAACPVLKHLGCVAASVAPPPDLGQLGLTRLEVLLSRGQAEAGALLRHCPLVEEVVVVLQGTLPANSMPKVRESATDSASGPVDGWAWQPADAC
jgi:hypothetical protein